MKGIFYNSRESTCSIWESGKMCYDALKTSDKYILDYSEEKSPIHLEKYDFMIYNYHFTVNNWITESMLKVFNKPNFAIVTEIFLRGENPIAEKHADIFQHYIILDPTIKETERFHAFVRPIEDYTIPKYVPSEIPEIFSFGFATFGKEWHRIVELVQSDYDIANIHFNIPKGTYIPENIHKEAIADIQRNIKKVLYKPEINVQITQDILSKQELLDLCARKTINCFYYNRNHLFSCGLSAVTDQAISAGRPIFITGDNTFRHLHQYIGHYPKIGIKSAIEETQEGVLKMKKEWTAFHFMKKFEDILFSIGIKNI